MIVDMERGASDRQVDEFIKRLKEFGFDIHLSRGVERTIIGAIGEKKSLAVSSLEVMDGVERIVPILQPFKLAGREFKPEKTIVRVGEAEFGGNRVPVIAGPAVESEERLLELPGCESGRSVCLAGGAYRRHPLFLPRARRTGRLSLRKRGASRGCPW